MRPRLDRPVIRGLVGDSGGLTLELPDGTLIDLGSGDFGGAVASWHVVAVEFELGRFLIISERRKRGGRYWVARAYHAGRRASFYLGRDFGAPEVREADRALRARLAVVPEQPSDRSLEAVVRDLLERERDGARRGAAEAIAAMVRRATDHRSGAPARASVRRRGDLLDGTSTRRASRDASR